MCSAISAAATHSVPAVQSRFGPRTSPVGSEVQGCTRALPPQRGWVSAQSPQQHPCLQLCNEDPGTAVEGWLQLLRPQATTVAWYSPVRALQKPHKEFQLQLDTVPASPPTPQAPTLPIEASTLRSSAVWSYTQPWALQFKSDYPPHTGQTQPWECLLTGTASSKCKSPWDQEHSRWSHSSPLTGHWDATEGTAAGSPAHSLPDTLAATGGDCWAWHLFPQVSLCKKEM